MVVHTGLVHTGRLSGPAYRTFPGKTTFTPAPRPADAAYRRSTPPVQTTGVTL